MAEDNKEDISTDDLIRDLKAKIKEKIESGETKLSGEIAKLKEMEREQKLEDEKKAGAAEDNRPPETDNEEEEVGIPAKLRVPRRYTMSDAAREARSKGGKARAETNPTPNWKTGKYARSAITTMRPCRTTCDKYPCELIELEKVAPGERCLDMVELVDTYQAFIAAIKDSKRDDYKEVVALDLAQMRNVLNMCLQAVQTDGPRVLSEKFNGFGKLIGHDIRSHPLLADITKLAEKVGATAEAAMITEREITKNTTKEKGNETLAEWMSEVGRNMRSQPEEEDG